MDGFYIILLVGLIGVFYILKYINLKQKFDKNHIASLWGQFGSYLKWGSIMLSLMPSGMLFIQVVQFSQLPQEDFEIFLTILLYVFPVSLLVLLSTILHLKYHSYERNTNRHERFDLFIKYAIVSQVFPYGMFLYFELALNWKFRSSGDIYWVRGTPYRIIGKIFFRIEGSSPIFLIFRCYSHPANILSTVK